MKLISNRILSNTTKWGCTYGKNNQKIIVKNNTHNEIIEDTEIECSVRYFISNEIYYVFIDNPNNKSKKQKETIGLFINQSCGYDVIKEKSPENAIIFESPNRNDEKKYISHCKIGLYKIGTWIKVYSYNNKNGVGIYELTSKGWYFHGYENN